MIFFFLNAFKNLIAEHFNLAISPVKRNSFALTFVEGIDLNMEWKTFDTLLIAEVC